MRNSSRNEIAGYLGKAGLALAFSLCLATAGCAVERTEADEGMSAQALAAQGASSGIPVQVDGFVSGRRGAALATAVVRDMPADVDGTAVHYAPCEPYQECPGDHVVWTFGPPSVRPASDYPAALHIDVDWIGSYRPSPDNVTVTVALFQDGNVVASAEGQIDAHGGVDDPAFRALIASMSRAIFSGSGWFD